MNHLWNLQLFSEGGAAAPAGGEGGGGAPAAQPSEARLRELGVPEERLQKRAKRKKGDVGAVNPPKESSQREQSGFAMKRTSDAMSALHSLADEKRYGVREDDKGGNGAEESVPQMGEQSPLSLRDIPPLHKGGGRSYDIRGHYDGMHRQAAELAARYPDFDLQKELDNPTFLRLTGPEIGLPLEDAYMALHHRELTRAIAEQSRRELSNSIRAGSARPAEHGMEAKAPSMVTFDYKNASRSQRAAFKKQIYDAAARGEKIYPAR